MASSTKIPIPRVTVDEATALLAPPQPPYSVFSPVQKKLIVFTAALASTFSPLSSNIYYPAINSIADELKISPGMVNLTITAYMVFQGLTPAFMGDLSDTAGRRPVYVLCFGIYIVANIGLALQRDFVTLLVLRALQSTGISATVALSNAVAADTVTSAERGMYLGIASLGGILGPALGPTLGGLLSQSLGWRSIFWFLALVAAVFFVLLMLFFPETCRAIVGNGSIPPPRWNRSLLDCMVGRTRGKQQLNLSPEADNAPPKPHQKSRIRVPNPWSTLRLLFEMPTGLVLLSNGIGYAAYYAVTSTVPTQWNEIYHLNDFQLGLTYIPIGLGTILSAFTNGWLVDWNFQRIARQVGQLPIRNGKQDLRQFPIERARLQIAMPSAMLAAASIALYGWVIAAERPIVEALAMLLLIGYLVTASYNVMNVLIVDLHYGKPATATAANNLVRCLLGAGATAGVTPLLDLLGRQWCFCVVGAIYVISLPLSGLVYGFGAGWREKRDAERDG
uniref:Major facilitator superfamily transporter n=1 Tax=Paecilomyces divaricatus TaxID=644132 RepID=A0A3G1IHK1_PAEDI|nr:major facilitator superfamily transporter [Paecilomyces divaricatus]